MNKINTRKQNGYAILFTVVIISIISLLAIGLSNSTYKQLILSSVSTDSQVSFFQADTAVECALYADVVDTLNESSPSPWHCGIDSKGGDIILDIGSIDRKSVV